MNMGGGGVSRRQRYRGIGAKRHRARFDRKVLRQVVEYDLPTDFLPSRGATSAGLLRRLGLRVGKDAETALVVALRGVSAGLPRAAACPVVAPGLARKTITDPLAVLAVIARSSESVWLRDRSPQLHRLETPQPVALWVPGGLVRR